MGFGQKELESVMKIAIDARMYRQSGVGRYIRNLIKYLQVLDSENNYYILLNRADFEKVEFNINFNKILADFGWYGIKEQIELPKILNKLSPDLVHFLHFNVPFFYNKKFVVTIHDLIHQHFQMKRATTHDPLTYKLKQLGYKKIFNHAIQSSEKIITVSEFVKKQLTDKGINEQKIIVTAEAVDDKILSAKVQVKKILETLKITQPYIFYIGNAHPHKNVEGLIKAFLKIRRNYQYLSLVLAGGEHYFWQKIRDQFQHNDIKYLGAVSDEQLVALYKGAKVFVMPSFEEGFGIPLLEAMACSCPVVSSNAASLPEVVGPAAIYFDPKDIDDMADKILQVLNSEKLKKELVIKGQKRVKLFSWQKLAKQTLKIYQDIESPST